MRTMCAMYVMCVETTRAMRCPTTGCPAFLSSSILESPDNSVALSVKESVCVLLSARSCVAYACTVRAATCHKGLFLRALELHHGLSAE